MSESFTRIRSYKNRTRGLDISRRTRHRTGPRIRARSRKGLGLHDGDVVGPGLVVEPADEAPVGIGPEEHPDDLPPHGLVEAGALLGVLEGFGFLPDVEDPDDPLAPGGERGPEHLAAGPWERDVGHHPIVPRAKELLHQGVDHEVPPAGGLQGAVHRRRGVGKAPGPEVPELGPHEGLASGAAEPLLPAQRDEHPAGALTPGLLQRGEVHLPGSLRGLDPGT